jgi:hypothetical protein
MPGLGATDPAKLEAKARSDLGLMCEVIGELIGSGERTLSAGPLETSPNTTLIRLERSMDN